MLTHNNFNKHHYICHLRSCTNIIDKPADTFLTLAESIVMQAHNNFKAMKTIGLILPCTVKIWGKIKRKDYCNTLFFLIIKFAIGKCIQSASTLYLDQCLVCLLIILIKFEQHYVLPLKQRLDVDNRMFHWHFRNSQSKFIQGYNADMAEQNMSKTWPATSFCTFSTKTGKKRQSIRTQPYDHKSRVKNLLQIIPSHTVIPT